MGIGYNSKIVTDGLVLALDAANLKSYPGSGTTWYDLSGNGNNGTLVNGVVYDSANSGNMVFGGVNDFVDCGKTASQLGIYDSDYTLSAFFRIPNLSGDKMVFGTSTTAVRQGMHHGVRNNLFYFAHYSADMNAGTAVANTWYYGTWVWSSTAPTARMYINGNLIQQSASLASFLGTTNILIGSSWTRFSGNIANAMIYNRALPSAEIKQNFNALRGRYGI